MAIAPENVGALVVVGGEGFVGDDVVDGEHAGDLAGGVEYRGLVAYGAVEHFFGDAFAEKLIELLGIAAVVVEGVKKQCLANGAKVAGAGDTASRFASALDAWQGDGND